MSTSTSYQIKLEQFEGPLDLLLSLIEKRKLFINEISLAKIADAYMEHIRRFEHFPLADTAHFILVASTLVLIKSRSLLPNLTLTQEEEGSIAHLEDRLKQYSRIKELSEHIKKCFGKTPIFLGTPQPLTPVFMPDQSMTLAALAQAVREVIQNIPQKNTLPHTTVKKVISLEEMIDRLTTRITQSLKMSFKDFSNRDRGEKVEVIVSFLALLELVKQGIVAAHQENHNADITMETHAVGVPMY